MFKKTRQGSMQALMGQLRNNQVICRVVESTLQHYEINTFKLEINSKEKVLAPPEISFRISKQVQQKLKEKIERGLKSSEWALISDSLDQPIDLLNALNIIRNEVESEDIGALQDSGGSFCVGVSVLKEEVDYKTTAQRLNNELRRCTQRRGDIYNHGNRLDSKLTEVQRILVSLVRVFLLIEEGRGNLTIGKVLFFPNVQIPIKRVTISASSASNSSSVSYTVNDVMDQAIKGANSKKVNFGYLTLNRAAGGLKFLLLDRNDPEMFHQKNPAVLGIWVSGVLGSGRQREAILWTVIMEYLTNPLIKRRYSLVGQRTGLLFTFEGDKKNQQIFELPQGSKWHVSANIETALKLPEEYQLSQQQVIMEEEKEQSEVQSVQSRQNRMPDGSFQGHSDNIYLSLQKKDQEIAKLKELVDFYKNECEQLREMVKNLSMQKHQVQYASPIYPPVYQPPVQSPPSPPEPIEPPHFGKKPSNESSKEKNDDYKHREFMLKDSKNISFAQENSYEEECPQPYTPPQPEYLVSPEFRRVSESRSKNEPISILPLLQSKVQEEKSQTPKRSKIQAKNSDTKEDVNLKREQSAKTNQLYEKLYSKYDKDQGTSILEKDKTQTRLNKKKTDQYFINEPDDKNDKNSAVRSEISSVQSQAQAKVGSGSKYSSGNTIAHLKSQEPHQPERQPLQKSKPLRTSLEDSDSDDDEELSKIRQRYLKKR